MDSPDIRIVLVAPSHPGNIGAVARAMKNMALSELLLVNPQEFPHPDATARASGADDVLAAARVVTSLGEALAGRGSPARRKWRSCTRTSRRCWRRSSFATAPRAART